MCEQKRFNYDLTILANKKKTKKNNHLDLSVINSETKIRRFFFVVDS